MRPFRRRLRLAVAAWLMFQVVSLSALVPRDCCDAHQVATVDAGARCHESTGSTYCPMRSKGKGRRCAMHSQVPATEASDPHAHHGAAAGNEPAPAHHVTSEHTSHEQTPHDMASSHEPLSSGDCAIGGTCPVPMTALAVIFSNHGVVPAEILIPANADQAPAALPQDEDLASRLIPPDSPPPRA
jgi:hypothetical protein